MAIVKKIDHISNYGEKFTILTKFHNFIKNPHIFNLFPKIRGLKVRKERVKRERRNKKKKKLSCQAMPVVRVAQIVASTHPGREKMERE